MGVDLPTDKITIVYHSSSPEPISVEFVGLIRFQFLDRDGAGVDYGEFQVTARNLVLEAELKHWQQLAFFNRASLAKQPRPKLQARSAAHHWTLQMEEAEGAHTDANQLSPR